MYTREQIQTMIDEQKRVKDLITTRESNKKVEKPSFSFMDVVESYIDQRIAGLIAEMKPKDGQPGKDGYTPKRGVDYFTPSELAEIKSHIESLTPVKGVHYFDGEPGQDGEDGEDGEKGDDGISIDPEDVREMVREMMNEIKIEKIGGITKKEVISLLQGNAITSNKSLEKRLQALQSSVMRNYGGHGGSTKTIVATLVSGGIYNLSPATDLTELQVFVGGGRLFSENGDFTYMLGGGTNTVNQITLANQYVAEISQGAILNIKGK